MLIASNTSEYLEYKKEDLISDFYQETKSKTKKKK